MKKIGLGALCFALFAFCSCQKDISEELTQQVSSADTLLETILVGDTVNPGKNLSAWRFIYDDQKRVTEIKYTAFDSLNGNLTIHEEFSSLFYYNGNERLPYKTYDYRRKIVADIELFHLYDNTGRLVLDSLTAPDNSKLLTNYDYSPGKIVVTTRIYDESGAEVLEPLIDSFYMTGNNLSNAFIFFPQTQGDEDVMEFMYDNKINPLSKLNIASYLGVEGMLAFAKLYILAPGYSSNNIVNRHSTSTTQPATNTNRGLNYEYNTNNLPVSAKFTYNGNGDEGVRIFYTYTH